MLNNINKKYIYLFLGVVVVVLIVVLLLIPNAQNEEKSDEYLIETPGVPKSDWQRTLNKEEAGDHKTITNLYDGYRIQVPGDWNTVDTTDRLVGLVAYKEYAKNTYPYTPDNLELRISVFEKTSSSLLDWLASSDDATFYLPSDVAFRPYQHPEGSGFRAISKVHADHVHDGEGEEGGKYYEKSSIVHIILNKEDVVYVISCLVVGEEYEQYRETCEQQIQTFDIIKE